jgi:hypothetical protein
MADKVILSDVVTFQNDTTAATNVNANSAAITTAMDNTLSRDGTSPNQMMSTLDMNSNHIINLPAPAGPLEPLRVMDVTAGGNVTVNEINYQIPSLVGTNVSGSGNIYTGSVSSGSKALTTTTATDFAVGQGIWIPGAGPANTAGAPTITSVVPTNHYWQTATVSGTAVTGDTVSLTFTSAGITGSPITCSYTVQQGDGLVDIARGLNVAMIVDVNLGVNNNIIGNININNIIQSGEGNVVNIMWPASISPSLVVTRTNGSSATIILGTPVTGSNTVSYQIVGRDANGGFSAATSATTITNSHSTVETPRLGLNYNRSPAVQAFNTVNFTVGANTVDVLIYRNNSLIAVVPASDGKYIDYGGIAINANGNIYDAPSSAPGVAGNGPLVTSVDVVSGTAITLHTSAGATVSSQFVLHDDGVALNALFAAAVSGPENAGVTGAGTGSVYLPAGTYNHHATLVLDDGTRYGGGPSLYGTGYGYGNSGTNFVYQGRGDQVQMVAKAWNAGIMEKVFLNGNFLALCLFQGDVPIPCNDNILRDCKFWQCNSGLNSASVWYWHPFDPSNGEVAGFYMDKCDLNPNPYSLGSSSCHIIWGAANIKNFFWINCIFQNGKYGISSPGSGVNSIINTQTGNITDTVFIGFGVVNVYGYEGENFPGCRLMVSGGNVINPGYATLMDCQHQTPVQATLNDSVVVFDEKGRIETSWFGIETPGWGGSCTTTISAGNGIHSVNNTYSFVNLLRPNGMYFPYTDYAGRGNGFPYFDLSPQQGHFPVYAGSSVSLNVTNVMIYPNYGNASIPRPTQIFTMGDRSLDGGNNYSGVPTAYQIPSFIGDPGDITARGVYGRQFSNSMLSSGGPVQGIPFVPLDIYGGGHIGLITTPSAPSVVVNSGTGTTYVYKVAYRDGTNTQITPLSPGTTVSGGAIANNTITVTPPAGTYYVDFIDATSGNHLIQSVYVPSMGVASFVTCNDLGQARTAYSPAIRNATGDFTVDGNVYVGGIVTAPAGFPLIIGTNGNNAAWEIDTSGNLSPTLSNQYSIGSALPVKNITAGTQVSAPTLQLNGVAFTGLPASPVAGMVAYVTDSNVASGNITAGSSTNKVLAWYNGTNWRVVMN